MKASLGWIRSLLPDLPNDPEGIRAQLTSAGLEGQGMAPLGSGLDPCEVALVVSMRPHPTKSGLRLVTVHRGDRGSMEVICGAPNIPEPGGLVVLAPLGTHLPAKGMVIDRR